LQGNTGKFKATIKITFRNEEDVAMFVQNYGMKNNETLRVTKARKASGNGEYTLIKYFRCHYHTRYEATMCLAQILAFNQANGLRTPTACFH
jgi:cupin superfamily acireductone dioxygenase involved in methionine salvage